MIKHVVKQVLRTLWMVQRPSRLARSGFVLPTVVMVVLLVVLTATALTYRSLSRSDQAISEREQRVITNAATPAIDRAKSKIEFLFQSDPRFPSGVPASDILSDLMAWKRNPASDVVGYTGRVTALSGATDPYTLPDETRIDINGDGELDNAWMFTADINGDGTVDATERVAYSILVDDTGPEGTEAGETGVVELTDPVNQAKADALVTRTGPLATTEATQNCQGALAEGGWQVVDGANNSALQKNFQITAFVANDSDVNQTFETLEFQQSRVAERANKWGAWYRYDLEIYPGESFNWNGAMHTEGNLIVSNGSSGSPSTGTSNGLAAHMVSSQYSCVYSKSSSEITLGEVDLNNDGVATPGQEGTGDNAGRYEFQGQVFKGRTWVNDFGGNNPIFHVWQTSDNTIPRLTDALSTANDSIDSVNNAKPSDIMMDPIKLFTQDYSEHLNASTTSPTWRRATNWATGIFFTNGRILNDQTAKPFVDDFFRADDRWGPKPRYSSDDGTELDITKRVAAGDITGAGATIAGYGELTDTSGGLDGYWERRAISSGLRLVVGERLELGNANGWISTNEASGGVDPDPANRTGNTQGDPLYPANTSWGNATTIGQNIGGPNLVLQRKSLRDNLAAVQGMAVYHYETNDGEFPLACYALTAHPGTTQSIINSRTFGTYTNTGAFKADFLSGTGTNGWEFAYHADFNTESKFKSQIAPTKPLGIALRNLAYFAGDPLGGAPSFPAEQTDGYVHSYPYLAMWGDFSILRRVLASMDTGGYSTTNYDALSFADKSALHTAACTLGMLAYNLEKDYDELASTLTNAPASMQNVATQTRNVVSDIIGCLEDTSVASSGNGNTLVASLLALLNGDGGFSRSWNNTNLAMVSSDFAITDRLSGGDATLLAMPAAGGTCKVGTTLAAIGKVSDASLWTDPDPATVSDTCPATGSTKDKAGFQSNCDVAEYFAEWSFDDWIYLLQQEVPSLTTADIDILSDFVAQINYFSSVIRDRDLGFREGQSALTVDTSGVSNPVVWDPVTGLTEPSKIKSSDYVFETGCNPNIFDDLTAGGTGGKDDKVMISLVSCSDMDELQIKYPSLYYLFPTNNHDHDGASYHQQPDDNTAGLDGGLDPTIQKGEQYVTDNYVETKNAGVTYSIVGADAVEGVAEIAATPRALTDWLLPHGTAATGTLTAPDTQPFAIAIGTQIADVAFLDKGLFDGREQLNLRVLDMDIKRLTQDKNIGDYWISSDPEAQAEGVVYAFREDAVREDEIVRPVKSGKTWANCGTFAALTTVPGAGPDCQMNIKYDPFTIANTIIQDPPLNSANLISPKPVDFYPDPMRRPYGFRLRNGADFSGPDMTDTNRRDSGLTLVTDNSVFIQGNFNLHSTDANTSTTATNLVEEFTQTLQDGSVAYGQPFYNNRTVLNTDTFAVLTQDHWRPVEILTDAVYVLSNNFKDGAVSDTFTSPTDGTAGGSNSSYMNQLRPLFGTTITAPQAISYWVQEDGDAAGTNSTMPVYIDRNGIYYIKNATAGGPGTQYFQTFKGDNANSGFIFFDNDQKDERKSNLINASPTYVNAIFVSGIGPVRAKQINGGLHNYPRFLENWLTTNLFIQGSFIQLNFSTAATAPFDQEDWEPSLTADNVTDNFLIDFYTAPNRRWGYDVGLLYVPPGPAARRFVSIGAPRSEYYRELPADDPYIVNLRCAEDGSGNAVFTDLCPNS